MSKKHDKVNSWGSLAPPTEYTYNYSMIDEYDDEAIEEIIEKGRLEYYQEWFSYIKDFE